MPDQSLLRLDLGIESLGVIIEAKIARSPSDFNKIEGELHADLGLYFKEPSKFDRMIVFARRLIMLGMISRKMIRNGPSPANCADVM